MKLTIMEYEIEGLRLICGNNNSVEYRAIMHSFCLNHS